MGSQTPASMVKRVPSESTMTPRTRCLGRVSDHNPAAAGPPEQHEQGNNSDECVRTEDLDIHGIEKAHQPHEKQDHSQKILPPYCGAAIVPGVAVVASAVSHTPEADLSPQLAAVGFPAFAARDATGAGVENLSCPVDYV